MEPVNKQDLIVFNYFLIHGTSWITNDELCELLPISDSSVKKRTKLLADAGVLERMIDRPRSWFRLNPKSLNSNPLAKRLNEALKDHTS